MFIVLRLVFKVYSNTLTMPTVLVVGTELVYHPYKLCLKICVYIHATKQPLYWFICAAMIEYRNTVTEDLLNAPIPNDATVLTITCILTAFTPLVLSLSYAATHAIFVTFLPYSQYMIYIIDGPVAWPFLCWRGLPWSQLQSHETPTGVFSPFMLTSSDGNILRVTGHLCGEFTGPW